MTGQLTKPFHPIVEAGITELIGVDEQVDQNDYGGSVAVALPYSMSGEILGVLFVSTEDGSGSVQTPAGTLLILDADPAVTAGDTTLTAADWVNVIGMIEVGASDWKSDATGAACYKARTPVAFHELATLYLVWLHEDATSFNDAGGDDEQLECNLWIRRDS